MQDFGFILDQIQGKLAGWKANLLSFEGRLVLTQVVTSTIPNYTMQCMDLPYKILQGVDRLNKNFLWGSSENKKKVHLVGWNKITRPKEEGGLGLQAAKQKNTAMLAKLKWKFQTEKRVLWVRVLSSKYCSQRRTLSTRIRQKPCSPVWSGLKKGMAIFNKGMKWIVGRNSWLSFWFDKWLDKGTC